MKLITIAVSHVWLMVALMPVSAATVSCPEKPATAGEKRAAAAVADAGPLPAGVTSVGGPSVVSRMRGALPEMREFGFTRILVTQRHRLNPTHVYTYHQEGLKPGGGLWIYDFGGQEVIGTKILDSSEGEIIDASLHYDGSTVLFSWKRAMTEPLQLYTIKVDGSGLTQVTTDDYNNFNACWLPDGGIAFLSDRKPAFAYCWSTTTPILYRCDRDGGNLRRLSANYLNDFTPSVLASGRIVYSRWEYVDRPAIPIQSLWTINPDGTGLMGLFGNRALSPATFMDAREIPDSGGKVIAVLTSHNGPCRGAIGIIDPASGSNSQEAITNITPEVNIGLVNQGNGNNVRGPYLNPFPLDARHYLVSKNGTVELRDYEGKLCLELVAADELGYYCPQPVRQRRQERQFASALPPAGPAGEQAWATVIMQDVYLGLGDAVARGDIKQLAVVQEVEKPLGVNPKLRAFGFQFPVVSCGATYAPKKIWGYATVQPDGSAHFKVPAQEPIYFLPLDSEGRAVQRMRTFTHLMPGEVQSCVGCHTDHNNLTPDSGAGGARPMAMSQSAEELKVPEWGVAGFGYAQIVQPIWDTHCVSCHGRETADGNLDLSGDKTDFFNVSYENLARRGTSSENSTQGGVSGQFRYSPYTSWIPTYNGQESNILEVAPGRWGAKASPLTALLLGGHPDSAGARRIRLSSSEKRRIFAWIDLNCPYYGTSDSNYREAVGCRQIIPAGLDQAIAEVAARRCVECHAGMKDRNSLPNTFYLRLDHPEANAFLRAPLARATGGTGRCGTTVFAGREDPDYQKLLQLFAPVQEMLARRPRLDMVGLSRQAADD